MNEPAFQKGSQPAEHRLKVRVYFEDTDCTGRVYHASYVRFCERARSEMLAATGTSASAWAERDAVFVVYRLNLTFRAAAKLGEELTVVTRVRTSSAFRATFEQRIVRESDQKLLVDGEVDIVCTDRAGALRELPDLGL
jgi:acyl-CoA thioester hydrolase